MLIKFWQIKGGLTMKVCFAVKEGGNRAKWQTEAILPHRVFPGRQCSPRRQIRKTSQTALTIGVRR
ncbi:hypothetical protein, partial [Bradyrhizobium sp. ORS 375]|uniref:hypothetical protein n=1 Tax=Bradyrhizobium sp. (strain ORS 375) TaxID=566679 RepID=UPI001AEBB0CA